MTDPQPGPQPGPWQRPPGDPNKPPSGKAAWLIVAAVLIGALTVYLMFLFPEAMTGRNQQIGLVHQLGLLALVGGSFIMHRRIRAKHALKHAAVWAGIAAALLLAYSLRHEAGSLWQRMAGELLPHRGVIKGGAVTLTARRGGHFVAEAEADGVLVRFLVDTGASDVVLSPGDAARLGFDVEALSYSRVYQTANGTVAGAPVRLGRIAIGPIVIEDVRASVNKAPMGNSLLGMSFLARLSSYEVSAGKLTLRP